MNYTVGKNIRAMRESRGMTIRELAQASDLSENYLSRLELGRNVPGVRLLTKIALGLGCEPGHLMPSLKELRDEDQEARMAS